MKVVATRSFFGSGINAKKGVVIEVSDKLAKAWLKAGLAVKADGKAEPSVVATTSPKSPETTGEVVDDQNADEQSTDGEADKEPTTDDDKTGTDGDEPQAPTAPATDEPQAPVAPQNNSNQNTKKGSK
jgi:hypothetical protein